MNERKNNGRGIFYGVIGVATLVVAIIGATFAYFTATASVNNQITGNMATITFNLSVEKKSTADVSKGGMIPMSNSMVERAFLTSGTSSTAKTQDAICTDDNGNAVCQVYKITVTNGGTATMLLDGYVALTGGSGNARDYTYTATETDDEDAATINTTMRWAQAFCTEYTEDDDEVKKDTVTAGTLKSCTTAGVTTTHATATGTKGIDSASKWDVIALAKDADADDDDDDYVTGLNKGQILTSGIYADGTISGNTYDIINTNYIRVSDHQPNATFTRTDDVTSALVFNQQIQPKDASTDNDTGDSNSTYTDAQVYYIVVWLSENGYNQTAGATADNGGETVTNPAAANFFQGVVTFNSAQGSEVTATFSGFAAVPSDQA